MEALTLFVAAIAWAAALAGPGRWWWRRVRPGSGLLFFVMAALGSCFVFMDDGVDAALRHAIPAEQNIEVLLRDFAGMLLVWSVQMLVLAATCGPEERSAAVRRRTALLPAALVPMTATFLIEFTGKPFSADYAVAWGRNEIFLLYSAIREGYFLFTLWDIRALTVNAVKSAVRPSVKAGLNMINAAVWFALVYAVAILVNLAVDHFRPSTGWILQFGTYSALLAGLLLAAGILTPVAGLGIETALRAPERRRMIKRLVPLARMLQTSQTVPLVPTQEQFTARLVELRDAARLVLPWCASMPSDATEGEVARALAAAAQVRRHNPPAEHRGSSLPAWFADPSRLALVADALSGKQRPRRQLREQGSEGAALPPSTGTPARARCPARCLRSGPRDLAPDPASPRIVAQRALDADGFSIPRGSSEP